MTERAAMMMAVCSNPADDTVRLVFADWLDEHEESQLAEFIRVGVAFSSHPHSRDIETCNYDARDGIGPEWKDGFELFDRMMTILWAKHGDDNWSNWEAWCWAEARHDDGMPMRKSSQSGTVITPHMTPNLGPYPNSVTVPVEGGHIKQIFRRGFVDELRLDSETWIRYADEVYWYPEQTVGCWRPKPSSPYFQRPVHDSGCYGGCRGTGRIHRPCPPAAHPITKVVFTHMNTLSSARSDYETLPLDWVAAKWPRISFFEETTLVWDNARNAVRIERQ